MPALCWPPLEKAQHCSQLHNPAAGLERDVHLVAYCVRTLPSMCSVLALFAPLANYVKF